VKATARPSKVSNTGLVANLSEYLELPDQKVLMTALLHAAEEEARHNSRFVSIIKTFYEAQTHSAKQKEPFMEKLKPSSILLKPIKPVENYDVDPSKPHDPYYMLDIYGPDQFTTLLQTLTLPELKASAAIVQKREGNKPESFAKRAAIISYLVDNLVGSR